MNTSRPNQRSLSPAVNQRPVQYDSEQSVLSQAGQNGARPIGNESPHESGNDCPKNLTGRMTIVQHCRSHRLNKNRYWYAATWGQSLLDEASKQKFPADIASEKTNRMNDEKVNANFSVLWSNRLIEWIDIIKCRIVSRQHCNSYDQWCSQQECPKSTMSDSEAYTVIGKSFSKSPLDDAHRNQSEQDQCGKERSCASPKIGKSRLFFEMWKSVILPDRSC